MKRILSILLLAFVPFLAACHVDPGMESKAIGLDVQVVEGWQPEIDAGYAVNISGTLFGRTCWPEDQPATGCTVDIAGHRSSHGSIFANVPYLKVGNKITVHHGYANARDYYVTGKMIVPRSCGTACVYGPLVLQTSYNSDYVWLIYAS